MAAECSGSGVYAVLDGGQTLAAATFARASAAWCTKADYSMVSLTNNQPRVMSGTGGTTPLGVFVEGAATNSVVDNRDLSQASWVNTNVTCVKSATGVDGVANSASRCTATGANGTALQTVTIAAATRNTSLYLRRAIGVDAISVTRDNGATWTNVTASLSSTLLRRVVSREAVGCAYGGCIVVPAMTSGGANPVVGISIGASGDAVDVDLVQDESGAYPTSPITTTAVAASRNVDSLAVTVSSVSPVVLAYSALKTGFTGTYQTAVDARVDGTHFFSSYISASAPDLGGATVCYAYTGGGTTGSTDVYFPPLGPVPVRCQLSPGVSIITAMMGAATPAATVASTTAVTSISVGGGIAPFDGLLTGVCVGVSAGDCSPRAHPTTIAWIGDSITLGDAAAPSRPPAVLRGLLPARTVYNGGVNGQVVAACASKALGAVASKAGSLVMLCGVNDIAVGYSATTAWATLRPALEAALAAGLKVVPVLLTPWYGSAAWTAGKQTETDALNSYIAAWCVSNGSHCVNTDSLGTGSPLALQAGYDSGDHIHLNATGAGVLAALVQAANP
jgi:lysophospholipase L1-like esterase